MYITFNSIKYAIAEKNGALVVVEKQTVATASEEN